VLEPALQRGCDGAGIERRAIVKLHPVDQVERVGQPVLGNLPALGEEADDLGGPRPIFDEALIDIVDGAHGADLEAVVGVERADIGDQGNAQHLLGARRYRGERQRRRERESAPAPPGPRPREIAAKFSNILS
jgi:hypothetical protein